MSGEQRLGGAVLCRVGRHRLAFAAREVVTIEPFGAGGQALPQARRAFALPDVAAGRALLGDAGDAVVVDGLEVYQEALPLWPAPDLVRGVMGGALKGFTSVQQELWPVFQLLGFSRFLSSL